MNHWKKLYQFSLFQFWLPRKQQHYLQLKKCLSSQYGHSDTFNIKYINHCPESSGTTCNLDNVCLVNMAIQIPLTSNILIIAHQFKATAQIYFIQDIGSIASYLYFCLEQLLYHPHQLSSLFLNFCPISASASYKTPSYKKDYSPIHYPIVLGWTLDILFVSPTKTKYRIEIYPSS